MESQLLDDDTGLELKSDRRSSEVSLAHQTPPSLVAFQRWIASLPDSPSDDTFAPARFTQNSFSLQLRVSELLEGSGPQIRGAARVGAVFKPLPQGSLILGASASRGRGTVDPKDPSLGLFNSYLFAGYEHKVSKRTTVECGAMIGPRDRAFLKLRQKLLHDTDIAIGGELASFGSPSGISIEASKQLSRNVKVSVGYLLGSTVAPFLQTDCVVRRPIANFARQGQLLWSAGIGGCWDFNGPYSSLSYAWSDRHDAYVHVSASGLYATAEAGWMRSFGDDFSYQAGGGVALGSHGVSLVLRFNTAWTRFHVPIVVAGASELTTPSSVLWPIVAFLGTSFGLNYIGLWWHRRRSHEDHEQRLFRLQSLRTEALQQQDAMRQRALDNHLAEVQRGGNGLRVLRGVYGYWTGERPPVVISPQDLHVLDVTIPLQFFVQRSTLDIPVCRKAHLMGFSPCQSLSQDEVHRHIKPRLFIRYSYAGSEHDLIVTEREPVHLPAV